MQKIRLNNGRIREVQDHLAFDPVLQKQQGFIPCDENGEPLSSTENTQKKSTIASANVAEAEVLTEETENQIIEAHLNGLSYVEIAKQHGLHWKKVEAVIERANS